MVEIVSTCSSALKRTPLAAKMRLGWSERSIIVPEAALLLEAAGARAITLHGRTKLQGYAGEGPMHHKFREFLGDYMALATGNRILQYQTPDGIDSVEFKAHHAGLTQNEMIVPMIVYQSDK